MRHIEGVVPCISFVETGRRLEVFALLGVERAVEFAIWQFRAKCAIFLRIIILIPHRTALEESCILGIFFCLVAIAGGCGLLGECRCHLRECKVGYIILKSMAHRVVVRCAISAIAVFDIFVDVGAKQIVLAGCGSALAHGCIGYLDVEIAHSAHP